MSSWKCILSVRLHPPPFPFISPPPPHLSLPPFISPSICHPSHQFLFVPPPFYLSLLLFIPSFILSSLHFSLTLSISPCLSPFILSYVLFLVLSFNSSLPLLLSPSLSHSLSLLSSVVPSSFHPSLLNTYLYFYLTISTVGHGRKDNVCESKVKEVNPKCIIKRKHTLHWIQYHETFFWYLALQ